MTVWERAHLFIERIAEEQVVVVFESHAAEDDDVDFRLHGDAGEQLVIGFAGDREDRDLLGFDEGVEQVDHGNPGTDHVAGNHAFGRIDRGPADIDQVIGDFGAVIARPAAAVEDTAQQIIG